MIPFSDFKTSSIFHLLCDSSQRDDTREISQHSREAQEVAAACGQRVLGAGMLFSSAALRCAPHCFLVRSWRVPLQNRPSPLLLALCASEDIRQQEKNPFYSRFSAVIQSASRLWMLVTPEGISFLKVKVLLSHFQKWFRILQSIWFNDGKVCCDVYWMGYFKLYLIS